MLDLNNIAVVDNHCHPILLEQHMDALNFRRYFTEATHPDFAQMHVPHTIYYLWLLRQLAAFYHCEPDEQTIIALRNTYSADELLQQYIAAARIDTLILDFAYPSPADCYTPERIGQVGGCNVARMLRLETLMERLVVEHDDFDAVSTQFSAALDNLREQGYCALKSIVAYRTGLAIEQWPKDAAVEAFRVARETLAQTGMLRLAHKPLIDYLLHIAFAKAAAQHVPLQFHTGYGDSDTDLRLGNPLHLRTLLEMREYWTMPIVLLHESYPYCQLGAYLAAVYPHVYFDLSYTIPFVEKLEMLAFTRQAVSVAPASKLMSSSDGIHVPEMYWSGAVRGRRVLADVLQEMILQEELDEPQALHIAQQVLHDTAYRLYNL
jgi:hypothetical protein